MHINQGLLDEMQLPADFAAQLPGLMNLNEVPDWVQPIAMVYSGHQFGAYNPRLGDGRGLLLAQWAANGAEWDLHLKGAGMTPFSRMGDGRAVLRSSIREYLAGEALHHLGIPTTRALAVALCPDRIYREQVEPGATLLRVTPCHIRFGHFEYFAYTGQRAELVALLDYVMQRYWPELAPNEKDLWFADVVRRNARLVAKWQASGFAHGVLNTDNMSIIGETFDFGPYAFINEYDPDFICNHSDDAGRYRFGRQPDIVYWNLMCLAQAVSSLIDVESLRASLALFGDVFWREYNNLMAQRLGFTVANEKVVAVTQRYLQLLAEQKTDYHLAFSRLINALSGDAGAWFALFCDASGAQAWFADYTALLAESGVELSAADRNIRGCAPAFVLRNYIVQNVIAACEAGDDALLHRVFDCLRNPFADEAQFDGLAGEVPEWGRHICISCSS
ncbi:MAG: YdiU family protein [Oceanospirillaceae bacterium]|nr:YdiU family protein [Oceanospirillaceae bacterium]MCP5349441.1 YdiU family protein [Oceanospirillaceae bacterium]